MGQRRVVESEKESAANHLPGTNTAKQCGCGQARTDVLINSFHGILTDSVFIETTIPRRITFHPTFITYKGA